MSARQPVALDDLPTLALLLEIVEQGSFSRVAKRRGLTTSAVSKRIARLEAKLGMALLVRTTRRLSATDAGRRLAARAEGVLGALSDAEEELSELKGSPRGALRVATSVGLGQSHVGRVITEFVASHPEASVELSVDERLVDLVAGHFDLAVRCGTLHDSSHTLKKIAPSKRVLCAAPSYLAHRGTPARAEELALHECLRHDIDEGGRIWKFGERGRTIEVHVRGSLHSDNPFVLRDAAVAGLGVAFLPSFVIADDVRIGRLHVVLDELAAERGWVYIALPSARPSRLARSFADFAASVMKQRLG